MGSGLSRPNNTSLPWANKKTRNILENMGVEFYLGGEGEKEEGEKEEETVRTNQMINVKLPNNWGLYTISDRGDTLNADLINDEGKRIAIIFWMSKGLYDNICRMTLVEKDDGKRLDFSKVKLDSNGYYQVIPSLRKQYIDMVNDYYESQYYGIGQVKLYEMYVKLKEFEKNVNPINHVHIDTFKEKKDDALKSATVAFAKQYSYTDPAPWLEI